MKISVIQGLHKIQALNYYYYLLLQTEQYMCFFLDKNGCD